LFRVQQISARGHREGTQSAGSKTRVEALEDEWVGEGCPSCLSPRMGVDNTRIHLIVKRTVYR
jgi:hypothetical protein